MYTCEESRGVKLNKIGVERDMAAQLSPLVAQFFGLTNPNQGYPLPSARLFILHTVQKKEFSWGQAV